MSLRKHQSITSDTRITASFNQSLLNQPKLAKQLLQSENCEMEFLRQKNAQLQQKIVRMSGHIQSIQKNKVELLELNEKYVRIVNEYYRRGHKQGKENKSLHNNYVLKQLQKDHRNLVKHCLNMETQIKNYTVEMKKFNEMKHHLLSVNHTNTKQLIEQLRILTEENKLLKKGNNQLSFDLQKSKIQNSKLKKGKEQWQQKADLEGGQLQRYKSLVNTIQQESIDRSNASGAKIYQLELKVQKLQEQLRKEQQYMLKTYECKRKLEIAQVQHIHQRDKLRHSLYSSKPKNRNNLSLYL